MKASYNWIARYVPGLPEPSQVAEKLTQMGWEVASAEPWGRWYEPVELVEVTHRVKHPDADHLSIVTVARGDGSRVDIVTGASNGMPGDHVWYAPVGTELVDGRVLEAVSMRGVLSPGMLLSASELGFAQGPQDLWIWQGPEPVGTRFLDAIGGWDTVFELELTPNLAVFGQSMQALARELAAGFSLPRPKWDPPFAYGQDALALREDAQDCPLYGLVSYQIRPQDVTPLWMQTLLRAIGQRIIFPAVDLTNFLLWDLGQPLHAFDGDKVQGLIQVRRARSGEELLTLDGQQRTLTAEDLVIADDQGPLALAGVMGGVRSAISAETAHVMLESAHFQPSLIFQTMRRHQIYSDAALHFGKGTDPLAVFLAPARYRALLGEAGLYESTRASQLLGHMEAARQISFEPGKIRQLLGVEWDDKKIQAGLERLGFGITASGDVLIPHDRHDVSGSHDLAEEVARLYGIDTIAPTVFSAPAVPGRREDGEAYRELMKNTVAEAGYWEVVTRSFTSPERVARAEVTLGGEAVVVKNPLRDEERTLRQSLLPGLLEVVETNRSRRSLPLRLFELAPVYGADGGTPLEAYELAVVETLEDFPGYPHSDTPHVLDLKGVLEQVNVRCGMGLTWRQTDQAPEYLHPGRTLEIWSSGGAVCGYLGEVRPRIAQRYHAKRLGVWVMRVGAAPAVREAPRMERPVRFPEVVRDLSVVVPAPVAYQSLVQAVKALPLPGLRSVAPIDRYSGEFGQSWTLRFVFQPDDATLTDAAVDGAMQQILDAMAPLGVTIRQ